MKFKDLANTIDLSQPLYVYVEGENYELFDGLFADMPDYLGERLYKATEQRLVVSIETRRFDRKLYVRLLSILTRV